MRNSQRQSEGTAARVCSVPSLPQEKNTTTGRLKDPECTKKGLGEKELRESSRPLSHKLEHTEFSVKEGRKWTLQKVTMTFWALMLSPTFSSFCNRMKCFCILETQFSWFYLESCRAGSTLKKRDQVSTLHREENAGGVRG